MSSIVTVAQLCILLCRAAVVVRDLSLSSLLPQSLDGYIKLKRGIIIMLACGIACGSDVATQVLNSDSQKCSAAIRINLTKESQQIITIKGACTYNYYVICICFRWLNGLADSTGIPTGMYTNYFCTLFLTTNYFQLLWATVTCLPLMLKTFSSDTVSTRE